MFFLKTDTFDLIDMQNSEIATLSGYAPLPWGTAYREIIIIELSLKPQFQRFTLAIHSNSKAVKYQMLSQNNLPSLSIVGRWPKMRT